MSSFAVNFYKCNKKLNSTKRPTSSELAATVQCIATEPLSIESPTLKLLLDDFSDINPAQVNFCKIPLFEDRYYFVEWQYDGGFWFAKCTIDALATYRGTIGESTQYILRSSYEHDPGIVDSLCSTTFDDFTTNTRLTSLINDGWYLPSQAWGDSSSPASLYNGLWCLVVVGNFRGLKTSASETSWTTPKGHYYVFNFSRYTLQIFNYLFSHQRDDRPKAADYITDMFFLPCSVVLPGSTRYAVFQFGYGVEGQTGAQLSEVALDFYLLDEYVNQSITAEIPLPEPSIQRYVLDEYWKNTSSFATLELQLEPFGKIALNADRWAKPDSGPQIPSVFINITIDTKNGNANLLIRRDGYDDYEQVATANVATHLIIAATTADIYAYNRQTVQALTGLTTGAIQATTAPFITAMGGKADSGLATMTSALSTLIYRGPMTGSTSVTGASGSTLISHAVTYWRRMKVLDVNNATMGRPLCQTRQISSIPGYVVCANVAISNAYATRSEISDIISFMQSGFYFETEG